MATEKIDQLRTTSYVSNEKRKTTCPLISWYYFQDSVEVNVVFVGIRKKYLQLKIRYSETLNNEYIERIHQMPSSSLSDNGMLQTFSFLMK